MLLYDDIGHRLTYVLPYLGFSFFALENVGFPENFTGNADRGTLEM